MISCRETLSVFSGASGRLDAIPFADEQLTTEAQSHRENLNRGKPKNRISLCLRDAVVKKLFLRAASARLTQAPGVSTLNCMEVRITPDLEAKLARLATERGQDTQALVQEAIEKFVDYDEWFLREVEKGLSAANRGELIDHEDIGKLINRRYPG
jgi:predicted transcriptional regulator